MWLGVFEMIVIIVIASLLVNLAREWLKTRERPEVDFSPTEARLEKVEALEERVRVLEAIVTDKGYDLKKEIENL